MFISREKAECRAAFGRIPVDLIDKIEQLQ